MITMLYSSKCRQWKIVDFGIMSHGMSERAVTTYAARGSSGYRAPEILPDFSNNSHFTNKVDIWVFGCIIIELITGTKAFVNDWMVREHYQTKSSKTISLDGYPPIPEHYLSRIILDLLQKDPNKRPRSLQLRAMFDFYSTLSDSSMPDSPDDVALFPSYRWLRKVTTHDEGKDMLLSRLIIADWYTEKSSHRVAILLLERAVDQSPDCDELIVRLDQEYVARYDAYHRVLGWSELLKRHSSSAQIWHQLVHACRELEELELYRLKTSQVSLITIKVHGTDGEWAQAGCGEMYWWDEAINDQVAQLKKLDISEKPTSLSGEVMILRKYCDWRGDVDKAIDVWKSLVAFRPDTTDFHAELVRAIDMGGDLDTAIAVWEDLVYESVYVGSSMLLDSLLRALEGNENKQETIRVLERLVKNRPNIPPIIHRLHSN